mmetsp:Transcript_21905/g.45011  ORF Transcript_21905/g.45011 Transcript_21905/m.45011 type:complete len:90 (-) Transcript_21905:9-278(-)
MRGVEGSSSLSKGEFFNHRRRRGRHSPHSIMIIVVFGIGRQAEATDGLEDTKDVATEERRAMDDRIVATMVNQFGFVMVARVVDKKFFS